MNNNINDLSILIKKALEYYDIQNTKYQHISKLINLPFLSCKINSPSSNKLKHS